MARKKDEWVGFTMDEKTETLMRKVRAVSVIDMVKRCLNLANWVADLDAEKKLFVKNEQGEYVPAKIGWI